MTAVMINPASMTMSSGTLAVMFMICNDDHADYSADDYTADAVGANVPATTADNYSDGDRDGGDDGNAIAMQIIMMMIIMHTATLVMLGRTGMLQATSATTTIATMITCAIKSTAACDDAGFATAFNQLAVSCKCEFC